MAQSLGHESERRKAGAKGAPELINVLGTSGAILAVVATGSAIVAAMPDLGPAGFAAAYLGPAGIAYAAYWWIAQRL